MKARNLFAVLLFAALPAMADVPATQTVDVVEFYNATLDHYFMTADPAEAADLDNGVHAGWARTGLTFKAIKAGQQVPGSTPIGRFYGKPEAHLDSHFYTASDAESTAVESRFADSWVLESKEVFRAFPVDPQTGQCPGGNEPIYRLYNKRSDVNHRYTDQVTVYQQMVAKGYVAEGNGNPTLPVIFCMPSKEIAVAPPGTPACTLSATSTSPLLGASITLTAKCTNAPTQYNWTNCVSRSSTCTATSTTAATVSYAVVGANATGPGNTAKLDVRWQSAGGPVPICTISASASAPKTGSGVTLTANCSQSPTQFAWMTCNYLIQGACNFISTCSRTSATCATNQTSAGLALYALQATNSAGQGPRATVKVDWNGSGTGTPTSGKPACTLTPSDSNPAVNSAIQLYASCSGNPTTYAWTNCTASGANAPTCTVTASSAGPVTYTVVGSNSIGNGAPASAQVNWQTPAPPTCTLNASNTSPMAGTSITLTANCSGSPTGWTWNGCPGSGSTCTASSASVGVASYSVTAVNKNGTGNPAGVSVNWQPPPTAPPVCQPTASNASPFTGQSITLNANCNNAATSYNWNGLSGCSSTSATCSTNSSTAGTVTYAVSATNVIGAGTAGSVSVNWQQSTGPGICSDVFNWSQRWNDPSPIYTRQLDAFRPNEVWVVSFTVPSSAGSFNLWQANTTVAEYGDPTSWRQMTLSTTPCDFRAMDRSGVAGPLQVAEGNTASLYWTVGSTNGGYTGLTPGQTYYVNIRNWNSTLARNLCSSSCNAIIQFNFPR